MPYQRKFTKLFADKVSELRPEAKTMVRQMLDKLSMADSPLNMGGEQPSGKWGYPLAMWFVIVCDIDRSNQTITFLDICRI